MARKSVEMVMWSLTPVRGSATYKGPFWSFRGSKAKMAPSNWATAMVCFPGPLAFKHTKGAEAKYSSEEK
jgi:hypothetical protein